MDNNQRPEVKNKTQLLYFIRRFVFLFLISFAFCLLPFARSVFAQESSSSGIILNQSPSVFTTSMPVQTSPSISKSSTDSAQIVQLSSNISLSPDLQSPGTSQPSAIIRDSMKLLPLEKSQYSLGEKISITVINSYNDDVTLHLLSEEGREIPFFFKELEKPQNGRSFIVYTPPTVSPGKYLISAETYLDKASSSSFLLGNLFANLDKSFYSPKETATVFIEAYDENGQKTCDADVQVEFYSDNTTNPIIKTSTNDKAGPNHTTSVVRKPQCRKRSKTMVSDYLATIQLPDKSESYQIKIITTLRNGTSQTLTKSIDVTPQPFEVARNAPSRVFPNTTYSVDLKITAHNDFDGVVSDYIPKPLEVAFSDNEKVLSVSTESAYLSDVTLIRPFDFNLGKPFSGDFVVTQGFADKELDYTGFGLTAHDGVDFGLSSGTPLRSADSGIVTHAAANPYGNTVIIEHSWGRTFYGHLSSFYVTEGQKVAKGDIVGLSGNTGFSTGPHLHFGILANVNNPNNGFHGKINPLPYLNMSKNGKLLKNPPQLFETAFQQVSWHVKLKKDESTTLSYSIKTPPLTPQTYALGPVIFEKPTLAKVMDLLTITPVPSSSSGDIVLATASSTLVTAPKIKLEKLYTYDSLWLIASDTQTSAAQSAHFNSSSQAVSTSSLVMTTQDTGFVVYKDLDGTCSYSKTNDSGNTWKKIGAISSSHECKAFSLWYDRWTEGDTTGNTLHFVYESAKDHRLVYRNLNTITETLSDESTILTIKEDESFHSLPSLIRTQNGSLMLSIEDKLFKCSLDCTKNSWKEIATDLPKDPDGQSLLISSTLDMILIHYSSLDKKFSSRVFNLQKNSWSSSFSEISSDEFNPSKAFSFHAITSDNDTVILSVPKDNEIKIYKYDTSKWTSLPSFKESDDKKITMTRLFQKSGETFGISYIAHPVGSVQNSQVYLAFFDSNNSSWKKDDDSVSITKSDLIGLSASYGHSDRISLSWIDPENSNVFFETYQESDSLEKKMRGTSE